MFNVVTEYPVAIESNDHKYPEGVYWDNRVDMRFIQTVENYYNNEKIFFMDQGCAGGALAVEMHKRGHKSIGLEGSDKIAKPPADLLDEYGKPPLGYENWQNNYNSVLFTCDLTKKYEVLFDGKKAKFDLITMWDVMEHFDPDQVESVLQFVKEHLKVGGIFVASIAIFHSGRTPSPLGIDRLKVLHVDYHKSVFPKEWWEEKCNKFLTPINYPFEITNRPINGRFGITNRPIDGRYFLYAGKSED